MLCSEDALARWLVQETLVRPERPTQVAGLRQAKQATTELRHLVERRYAVLADADDLARQLFRLVLISGWGDGMCRPEPLLDALRRAEETAEDGRRQAISSRSGHGRRRVEGVRLWLACMVRTRRRPGGLASQEHLREPVSDRQ